MSGVGRLEAVCGPLGGGGEAVSGGGAGGRPAGGAGCRQRPHRQVHAHTPQRIENVCLGNFNETCRVRFVYRLLKLVSR